MQERQQHTPTLRDRAANLLRGTAATPAEKKAFGYLLGGIGTGVILSAVLMLLMPFSLLGLETLAPVDLIAGGCINVALGAYIAARARDAERNAEAPA